MKPKKSLINSLLATAALLASASSARAEVLFNEFVPFQQVFVACDDVVAFTGELHVKLSQTIDENGGAHLHLLTHPAAVEGVSLIDGTEFIGTGANSRSTEISLPEGDGTQHVASMVILVAEDGRVYAGLLVAELTIENFQVVDASFTVAEVICL